MKSTVMHVIGGFSSILAESKIFAYLYSCLPRVFKTYDCSFIPTFSQTNITKEVDIPAISRLDGWLREVYGIRMLPYFKANVAGGFNRYILKTVSSKFIVYSGLKFGQQIRIKVSVISINESTGNFSLSFSFFYKKELMVNVEQEIFYVNTDKNVFRGELVKHKVFRAIKALGFQEKEPFNLNDVMKRCIRLKRMAPDYSFNFRWDLRSSTEEGNTNHAAFLEYLMAGLENFLISRDISNKDKFQNGILKVTFLEIAYLKDFHFFQEAKIDFFQESLNVYNFIFSGFDKDKSLAGGKIIMDIY